MIRTKGIAGRAAPGSVSDQAGPPYNCVFRHQSTSSSLCDAARLEIDVSGDKDLSAEEVIATLSAALSERYGETALAVALRQAELAEGLPRETWDAIVARLRDAG
jgi:hypothetical protein